MTTSTAAGTYYRDIAPIVDSKCAGCHDGEGVAPFALDDLESVTRAKAAVRHVVDTQQMPPWPPVDCCAEYAFDRSLSEAQRSALLAWIDGGAPAGDPADRGPALPRLPGLSRVDLTLSMPSEYTPAPPEGGTDDLRCFLIDWPEETKGLVTGIDVHPGQPRTVHHVIVYLARSEGVPLLSALDDADDRPGWDCPGGIGASTAGALGGWAPGFVGVEFPGGVGIEIPDGAKVVLQMHYDIGASASAAPDRTSVDLRLDTEVTANARGAVVMHPQWLFGSGLKIEAGAQDAVFAYRYDPTALYGRKALHVLNANLHMHEIGRNGRLGIHRADGSYDCLLQIDDWDYDWQGEYWLETPARLEPGDELYVECHFDNTEANQPSIGGEAREVSDLAWGNDQEMCIGFFLVSAAP